MSPRDRQDGDDLCAVFVHAGAGYHSLANEPSHLRACSEAAALGMMILKAGGNAVDAVEMMIKMMEDREITNAGFGSNLTVEGEVECDATVVDHYGRNGAVGAVSRIKNPISLARLLLEDSTKPMLLARVPPNLLVGEGATNYAVEKGMEIFPARKLVSQGANDRWLNWKRDLEIAHDRYIHGLTNPSGQDLRYAGNIAIHPQQMHTPNSSPTSQTSHFSQASPPRFARPLAESAADTPTLEGQTARHDYVGDVNQAFRSYERGPSVHRRVTDARAASPLSSEHHRTSQTHSRAHGLPPMGAHSGIADDGMIHTIALDHAKWRSSAPSPDAIEPKKAKLSGALDGSSDDPDEDETAKSSRKRTKHRAFNVFAPLTPPFWHHDDEPREDSITDTVGAIVVDYTGKLAAGSSSGGIGMKHKGRAGPAALVGVGTTVVPVEPGDPDRVSVATVTSGTGEHMATTMAAHTCADRVYNCVRRRKGGGFEYASEDEALRSMIESDFMDHPGVRHSPCVGALGVMAVKRTKDGIFLYFGHNTESFALASMSSNDNTPLTTMSRTHGRSAVAIGGRGMRAKSYRR